MTAKYYFSALRWMSLLHSLLDDGSLTEISIDFNLRLLLNVIVQLKKTVSLVIAHRSLNSHLAFIFRELQPDDLDVLGR